jgi:hypothetical protein
MEKDTLVSVANRTNGNVGYGIPNTNIQRSFAPRQSRDIPFDELEQLIFTPGGEELLKNYLVVRDKDALSLLLPQVEPEYFYSEEDVINLLTKGSYAQLLDCLDFAPKGVIELVKSCAVSLPLADMNKRNAIQEKTGFNVTMAIQIQETKNDGETATETKKRRTDILQSSDAPVFERRTEPPKYDVVKE